MDMEPPVTVRFLWTADELCLGYRLPEGRSRAMRSLDFFACYLLAAAIASDLVGKAYDASAARIVASAAGGHHAQHAAAGEKADATIIVGNRWTVASTVLAAVAFGFFLVSLLRRRRLSWLPLLLLILYAGVWLLMV